jgi:hypothetical protein
MHCLRKIVLKTLYPYCKGHGNALNNYALDPHAEIIITQTNKLKIMSMSNNT